MERVLSSGDTSPEDMDLSGVEEGVCRLEDVAMILLTNDVRWVGGPGGGAALLWHHLLWTRQNASAG